MDCAGVEAGLNMLVGLEDPCAGSARAAAVAKQGTPRAIVFRVTAWLTTSTLVLRLAKRDGKASSKSMASGVTSCQGMSNFSTRHKGNTSTRGGDAKNADKPTGMKPTKFTARR